MKIPRVLILPSLCTLANALCGFGAITLMTHALLGGEAGKVVGVGGGTWTYWDFVQAAGFLVLLAMVFDALDGRLARFARATSDFGGQLDSVADVVSFGVAPAFLMNRVVVESLRDALPGNLADLLRAAWVCAAVYLGCTLIRLARFNVENVHEEEAHMVFKGLPSPAAAGALVSVIIVVAECMQEARAARVVRAVLWAMPLWAAVLGLLMVSSIRYAHLLNQFARRRRPVNHLVLVLLAILIAVVLKEIVLPVGFGAYVLSGPAAGLWRRLRGRRAASGGGGQPGETAASADEGEGGGASIPGGAGGGQDAPPGSS